MATMAFWTSLIMLAIMRVTINVVKVQKSSSTYVNSSDVQKAIRLNLLT